MLFLENRVAELEARLATYSPDNVDVADHLRQNPFTPASPSSGTVSNQNNPHNNYAAGVALLSLNSANEPHYLGLSSGFSWARTILGIFKPPSTSLFTPDASRNRPSHPSNRTEAPKFPSEAASDARIEAFYMHVQARHPFMDWRQLKSWVHKRELLVGMKSSYEIGTPRARLIGTASFFIW
ncbi:hypothetical protein EHS25_001929 [Saitozyma podzolica]|jgi:hypothetical protein|uniref:Uncharacterized protein n=1 Tax=Saitozyma podzolica TaxID=1890683 RepID=A0A427YFX2_9TREE|nr:hypothetical protein EHS25_001929 [Saitozyma podzolica]